MKPHLIFLLAACGSSAPREATPPVAPVSPAPAPVAPQPVASRDVSGAWMTAVAAHDAKAIEGLLDLPFTLYYDDNWTGKRPADCDPVRVIREVTTASERTAVAKCVAATVQFSTVAPAAEPIGIWEAAKVIPALPEPVQDTLKARSSELVFVRGPSIAAGDFDFTVGVPKTGDPKARLVVLWTING